MKGVYPVFKPKGPTSHDIIDQLRLITKEKKIGHAGTLDPLAQGVLIVAFSSEFTKKLGFYSKMDKEYQALACLGWESSTDDQEGIKKKVSDRVPCLTEIKKAIKKFKGKTKQTPPNYSAIKISGKRAYLLARKNIEFSLEPRTVEIKEIELINYQYPELELKVKVSSGTYIRSLIRDIGREIKTGAYLKELTRTKVGDFTLEEALNINYFNQKT
jgi:tRNA pseudouridine55 synthase